MTFLSGAALWLLGLAAVVALIYFLKRQARIQPVSALFLWQRMERRPRSAIRFQWTQILSLILQLVALAALVTGLAQPVVYSISGGVERLAIILDGSASMRALTAPDGLTRYQQGLKRVEELLTENPAAETVVIQAQAQSFVLAGPTKTHSVVRKALQGAAPSYQGDAKWSDLLNLVVGQTGQAYERVVLITDHAAGTPTSLLGWEVAEVGTSDDPNIALTDFLVREQPDGRGYDLFIAAYNSTAAIVELPLTLLADDVVIREEQLQIPPQGEVTRSVPINVTHADRFTATLNTTGLNNDWTDDDVRYATSPRPKPWKILWVGADNFYLESFLNYSGEADLTKATGWDESLNLDQFDLVILNQISLPATRSGNFLVLGGSFGAWVTEQGSRELASGQIDVESDHPLLQGMDPTAWRLLAMPEVSVSSQGHVLLSAEGFPFFYVLEKPGLRLAYFAADLEKSNLVLSIDFPVLIYRVLTWLAPRSGQSTTMVAGGELPLSVMADVASITDPSGQKCLFDPAKNSECGHVDQPGYYEVTSPSGNSLLFAVNAAAAESRWNEAESEVADRQLANIGVTSVGGLPPVEPARELKTALPIWPYLLAFGLLLLVVELLAFHNAYIPATRTERRRVL